MEKISCTLGLLLIFLAERKLLKQKGEINIYPCHLNFYPRFVCRSHFNFRTYEQLSVFLQF